MNSEPSVISDLHDKVILQYYTVKGHEFIFKSIRVEVYVAFVTKLLFFARRLKAFCYY